MSFLFPNEPKKTTLKDCPECEGRGWLVCPECDGKGVFYPFNELSKCNECKGSGKVKCPECFGFGWIK